MKVLILLSILIVALAALIHVLFGVSEELSVYWAMGVMVVAFISIMSYYFFTKRGKAIARVWNIELIREKRISGEWHGDRGMGNKHNGNQSNERLKILDAELINCYTSLSWKYKLISDFCRDFPEDVEELKETERYKSWRRDVMDWAKYNLYRLDSFYFSDGFVLIIDESTSGVRELVDLNKKFNYPLNPKDDIICDVEIGITRLPKDYFEFPNLVWEDEEDDYDYNSRCCNDDYVSAAAIATWSALHGGE